MSEPTPGQILALTMDVEQGTITIRERLTELLGIVWSDPMGFDGKRPWGFSSWLWDFYNPLVAAGFMADGEHDRGRQLIATAIEALATEWVPTDTDSRHLRARTTRIEAENRELRRQLDAVRAVIGDRTDG